MIHHQLAAHRRTLRNYLLILLAILAVGQAPTFGARNDEPAAFREGIVLVGFRRNMTPAEQSKILSNLGVRELKRIGVGVHVLSVERGSEFAAIQVLKARGEIRYAEPDYLHTLSGSTALPNDSSVGVQWAVQNTGQAVNGTTGRAGADVRSPAAWTVTTGASSVVVAIIDSGVQYSHPDLITNMWTNPGGIGGCPAGTHGYNVLNATCDPMDDETFFGGHGTHVSGIAAAAGNNAAGVAGVNWTSSIMGVKWFPATGSGATSDLIAAMDWVVQAKLAGVNVRVANDSATWPGTGFSQALSDEIDLLGSNDILFVAAAGNSSQNDDTIPRYPCSYDRPTMICVGASDQNDNLWSTSNFGAATVKLAAPGVNIYSTKRLSDYGYISGCSMAAPQVSGTAALILSLGYKSVTDLKSTILAGVDPLPSLSGLVATGGRLNVCKAVPGCVSAIPASPVLSASPTVTGLPQFGSMLGASTGLWSGGPTAYTYQWYRCSSGGSNCLPIAGALSASYAALASADVGATLSVAITASNTLGSSSAPSLVSLPVSPASSPFVVSSTIRDGQTIGAPLQWKATPAQPVNFVQFYIDGVLSQTFSSSTYVYNQGTTGLFDPGTLSAGTHVLGIRALSNENRSYGFYGATVTVTAGSPVNTGLPAISGSPVQGQTLSTSNGLWTNSPTGYAYQWNRCDGSGSNCRAIPGATSGTYAVASADVGFTLRSFVTATNPGGSNTAMSSATAIVTGTGGGGGIALIQSNAAQGSGVPSISAAFSAGNNPGNLIIAFVRMSSASQTVAVTDSAGNVYADAVAQAQTSDGHQAHIFYARNIAGGANTVKASFSSTNNHPWLAIYEYSGLSATNPLDQTSHAQGSGSSPNSGATGVTTAASELLFAGNAFPNSYAGTATAGGGYSLQQQNTGTSRAASEAEIVAATGSYAGTLSLSSPTNWSAVLATFRAAGSVNSPPVIATNSLPNGTQNTFYSATLTATGGTGPYAWSVLSGTLPSGLALASGTGSISGTPGAAGTSNFTVQVKDANSQTATKALVLTINPVSSGIAMVQSIAVEGSGVGSVTTAFPSSNTAANLIIAVVRMSSTTQTVGVTDSAGNVYTDAVTQGNSADGHQVHIFYARNIAGGANSVTAAFSSANNHPWLAIYEYSGLNPANPLDQTAHAQGSSAAPSTGSSAVTASSNELVIAAVGFPNNYSGTVGAGGGYALQQQDLGTSRAASEAALVNATGSYAGTFSLNSSTNWSAVLATFRQ